MPRAMASSTHRNGGTAKQAPTASHVRRSVPRFVPCCGHNAAATRCPQQRWARGRRAVRRSLWERTVMVGLTGSEGPGSKGTNASVEVLRGVPGPSTTTQNLRVAPMRLATPPPIGPQVCPRDQCPPHRAGSVDTDHAEVRPTRPATPGHTTDDMAEVNITPTWLLAGQAARPRLVRTSRHHRTDDARRPAITSSTSAELRAFSLPDLPQSGRRSCCWIYRICREADVSSCEAGWLNPPSRTGIPAIRRPRAHGRLDGQHRAERLLQAMDRPPPR